MKQLTSIISYEGEKIKGSRFIVNASPVFSEQEAKNFIEKIENQYSDARHHCYAYRLMNGIVRSSDAGEPRGTGGLPILQHLDGLELINTIAVVTRYFGGVKLGVGGLIRAYGGAVGEALKTSECTPIQLGKILVIDFDYSDDPIFRSILRKYDGELRKEEYGIKITMHVFVLREQVDFFIAELIEKSSNRINICEENNETKMDRNR